MKKNKFIVTVGLCLILMLLLCEPAFAEPMYVTAQSGLNIRTAAGADKEKVTALPYGTEVEVVKTAPTEGSDSEWAYIEYDGKIRYCCAAYLSAEKPEPRQESSQQSTTSVSTQGMRSLGVCRITHYCNCSICCGQWAGGGTASGAPPVAGVTVAGDLPFGTQVVINGHTYTVQDRGVGGNWFDIYCDSHSEALNRGEYYTEVFVVG